MHKARLLRGVDVPQHFPPHCPHSPAGGNTAAGPPCPTPGWLQGAGVEKKGQLVLLGETPYKEL